MDVITAQSAGDRDCPGGSVAIVLHFDKREAAMPLKFLILTMAPIVVWCQDSHAERPEYKLLRYDEDWSSLRDRSGEVDWTDRLKYIPFGPREGWYATIGGEIRERFEFFDPGNCGREP